MHNNDNNIRNNVIERLDVYRIERPEKPDAMAKLPTCSGNKMFSNLELQGSF